MYIFDNRHETLIRSQFLSLSLFLTVGYFTLYSCGLKSVLSFLIVSFKSILLSNVTIIWLTFRLATTNAPTGSLPSNEYLYIEDTIYVKEIHRPVILVRNIIHVFALIFGWGITKGQTKHFETSKGLTKT